MSSKEKKNHHWWPVGLQARYWADKKGYVSWITPDGIVRKKKAKNRKIAYKRHGHTISFSDEWKHTFEDDFSIDGEVHRIIEGVKEFDPLGTKIRDFRAIFRKIISGQASSKDFCAYYRIKPDLHRDLLLLILSLLIRSPANRDQYEQYPSIAGLPRNTEIGKANMVQEFRFAKKRITEGPLAGQFFVFLNSPKGRFVFGDGALDWISREFSYGVPNGRALISLTPHLCIYFCTPRLMCSSINCASLVAPTWLVKEINSITMACSRQNLFFLGKPPRLTKAYMCGQYLELESAEIPAINLLDGISGNQGRNEGVGVGPLNS